MLRIKRVPSLLILSGVLACNGTPGEDRRDLSKEDAREQGGKGDDGTDYCELFDWYGDGICDDFCPEPDPDCASASCESVGGTCESSPIDVGYAANCEEDFGLTTSDATCPAINQACCVTVSCPPMFCTLACAYGFKTGSDGCVICECADPPAPTCEAMGGVCKSSPIDVTFPANCEEDFGLTTSDATCPAINQACCYIAE